MEQVEIAKKYLMAFANKDISFLEAFLEDSVELRDWDITALGKKEVIQANREIFEKFDSIDLEIINLFSDVDTVIIEFDLLLQNSNENIALIVVDIISFNSESKISEIRAFRGN